MKLLTNYKLSILSVFVVCACLDQPRQASPKPLAATDQSIKVQAQVNKNKPVGNKNTKKKIPSPEIPADLSFSKLSASEQKKACDELQKAKDELEKSFNDCPEEKELCEGIMKNIRDEDPSCLKLSFSDLQIAMSQKRFISKHFIINFGIEIDPEAPLKPILERNPNNVFLLSLLSRIKLKKGEIRSASGFLEQAETISPNNETINVLKRKIELLGAPIKACRDNYAKMYARYKEGTVAEAIKALQDILNLFEQQSSQVKKELVFADQIPYIKGKLAVIYYELGDFKKSDYYSDEYVKTLLDLQSSRRSIKEMRKSYFMIRKLVEKQRGVKWLTLIKSRSISENEVRKIRKANSSLYKEFKKISPTYVYFDKDFPRKGMLSLRVDCDTEKLFQKAVKIAHKLETYQKLELNIFGPSKLYSKVGQTVTIEVF